MTQRSEILDRIHAIPALPAAATRALELAQNPDVSMGELVEVIEYDPGLTSNMLRIANSSYFGGRNTISTLRDAVVRMGIRQVCHVMMTTAITPVAGEAVKGYDLAPGSLLDHAVATATGTEALATVLNRPAPGYAFTVGLLHDVGKVVLGTFVAVDAAPITKLAFEKGLPFNEAEREVIGLDHAEAGAELLTAWELPENIVQAVRWHHAPEQFPGDDPYVVDLVHAADFLAIESGIGVGVDGLNYRASDVTVERLQLKAVTTERVLCEMMTGLGKLREVLNIDMGS